MKVSRQFALTLNSIDDYAALLAWLDTDEVKEFLGQLQVDLPDWYNGGETVPEEYIPLDKLITYKKEALERLDEEKNRYIV